MKARPWEYWRNVQVLAYRWAKGRIRDHERFLSLVTPVLAYEGFLAMDLDDPVEIRHGTQISFNLVVPFVASCFSCRCIA
jgi:hypothetical protein